jgi:hypothetical protein
MQIRGSIGSKNRNSLCPENECKAIYGAIIPSRTNRGPHLIVEISHRKKGNIIPQMAGIPAYAYQRKGCVP